MQLTKVNKKGFSWSARFEKDGEISSFDITEQEFNDGPTKEGWAFVDAQGGSGFDTVSGKLEDGQYADLDENICLVKLADCVVKTVEKNSIVDDVISDELVTAMSDSDDNNITLWR